MKRVVSETGLKAVVNPVVRLTGETVLVMGQRAVRVNETVQATLYTVQPDDGFLPEERGLLLFLPISDNACNVQLQILLHHDNEEGTGEVLALSFHPDFMAQWSMDLLLREQAFRRDQTTERTFEVSAFIREEVALLAAETGDSPLQYSLRQTEAALRLLRRVTDRINIPFTACPVPACRFLAYESEREKIFRAREILDQKFDQAISIKELARAVAMNECYLKKGFKTLIGATIHEYQLGRRIEKAKELLQAGISVTDVAADLGYSSISHFSTAFKKATGWKPCELLR